jgi:hypothetical protein
MTVEQEDNKDSDLEDSLSNDVSPHYSSYNALCSFVGWLIKDIVGGWLGSKSKSTTCVHDQVYPEHLHGGQRRFRDNDTAKEDNEHCDTVNCQLEL